MSVKKKEAKEKKSDQIEKLEKLDKPAKEEKKMIVAPASSGGVVLAKKTPPKKKFDMAASMGMLSNLFKEDYSVGLHIHEQLPHISTGSLVFDRLFGGQLLQPQNFCPCPGLPKGRITTISGEPSTGKTTFGLQASAEICRLGGHVLYLDWEREVAGIYAHALGCPDDPNRFRLWAPNTLEEGIIAICMLADQGIDLIIVDSIGAAMPRKLFEQSGEEIGEELRMGLVASLWSKYLPKIKNIIARSGTCILGISQLRDSMSKMGMGPTTKAQGGKAWEFYASVRIKLRKHMAQKGKVFNPINRKMEDQVIGTKAIATLEKCKISDMEKKAFEYYLRWGEGIDNANTMIDMGVAYGVIKKKGNGHSMELANGTVLTARSREAFREALNKNTEVYTLLFNMCRTWMQNNAGNLLPTSDLPSGEDEFNVDDYVQGLGGSSSSSDEEDDEGDGFAPIEEESSED